MKPRDLIIPYFKANARTIALGLAALIVVDVLQLLIPRVIKAVVDDLTMLEAGIAVLLKYAATLVVMGVGIGVFRYVWRRCLLGTARYLEAQLRNRFLKHIQTLSASFFDRAQTGELMAHATNDIMQVRMATGMGLVALNDAIVLGAAAIGFMLYIHVRLTLYVLIPMPVIVVGARILSRRMHKRYQAVQAAFADLTEAVRERCAGIHMVKAHHNEHSALAAVREVSQFYVDQNMRLVGITSLFFPLMMMLTNLSLAAVLYLGGRNTIFNEITPGDFAAFISYLNLLTWPMMAMGWVTSLMQRGGASLHRLNRIFEQQPEIRVIGTPRRVSPVAGAIAFENVSFAYGGPDDELVLSDVSLNVAPGQCVGIIGPPGSGKSTLLRLIPRLYDPTAGKITLGDVDLRHMVLGDLRRQVAYVPQEPFIFDGTIRDNILFGCPRACLPRLDNVVADAGLADVVAHLNHGLDTQVGEKGVLLSGGQKQRIVLARALLIDAPIILLDDPISQVDTATAAIIVAAIQRMAGQKTVLVVSHRLAAVRPTDWIVTMKDGVIVESGSHPQLLARNGYYTHIHRLQELDHAL